MKFLTLPFLILSMLLCSGCYSMYDNLMADTVTGSPALANATDDSIKAMFPIGTPKTAVMQTLGVAASTSSDSDGTTTQSYNYCYTSYSQHIIRQRFLTVSYDKTDRVSKLSFSKSETTF
jgi:hypothetical protein